MKWYYATLIETKKVTFHLPAHNETDAAEKADLLWHKKGYQYSESNPECILDRVDEDKGRK